MTRTLLPPGAPMLTRVYYTRGQHVVCLRKDEDNVSRVAVVGLDALDAAWVDEWLDDLPNLRRLVREGIHGPLRSIVQPVTPVAWTSAISGRNPGHFGFTDSLYRPAGGYGPFP